jgi:hypothetical protein
VRVVLVTFLLGASGLMAFGFSAFLVFGANAEKLVVSNGMSDSTKISVLL